MAAQGAEGRSQRVEIELPLSRWSLGRGLEAATDRVALETTVEIAACGVLLARLQCLPADLEDLGVGFALSEGFAPPGASVRAALAPGGGRVELEIPGADASALEARAARGALASGCGRGLFISEIRARAAAAGERGFAPEEILEAVAELERSGRLFRSTGCVHAAAVRRDGRLLGFREDIGRHNAIDKAAGAVARSGGSLEGTLLVTTGRLSADVAAKAVRLGAWGLASRGAPTARAVEIAAEMGLVLAGFARGGRLNIYCGAQRLAGLSERNERGEPPRPGTP